MWWAGLWEKPRCMYHERGLVGEQLFEYLRLPLWGMLRSWLGVTCEPFVWGRLRQLRMAER